MEWVISPQPVTLVAPALADVAVHPADASRRVTSAIRVFMAAFFIGTLPA
jgi:hypothetical protein